MFLYLIVRAGRKPFFSGYLIGLGRERMPPVRTIRDSCLWQVLPAGGCSWSGFLNVLGGSLPVGNQKLCHWSAMPVPRNIYWAKDVLSRDELLAVDTGNW